MRLELRGTSRNREKEKESEEVSRRKEWKSTRPKVPTRHSFRLTAYLIKTTLSRPACAVNDAAHGPCNRQTKRERVAAERRMGGWERGGRAAGRAAFKSRAAAAADAPSPPHRGS